MAFGDCFRSAPPYHAHGYQPVTSNQFYNNATPEWYWDYRRGEWQLGYTYQGIRCRGQPDQRITNSWYGNYGAERNSTEPVVWDWVWDPRLHEWIQQPVGSQPYGTTRSWVPKKLTRAEKKQMEEAAKQQDATYQTHWHVGNTYVVDSNQATYGTGSGGFKKRFVKFLGLSSGS